MSHIRLSFCLGLVAFLTCAVSSSGFAQQPTQAQQTAIRNSCRNDYMAHCSSVPSGTKQSLQCLAQNMSALSPPCASAVQAAMPPAASAPSASAPATTNAPPPAAASPPPHPMMTPREVAMLMRRSCGADFRAYCSGVPLGGGRGVECLMRNQARLSQPCKAALAEHASQ
jgi:hypothetical protein